jgi:N6-adenosine-specific RNA methylase IME4
MRNDIARPMTTQPRYSVIYADPPWDYKGQQQHAGAASAPTGGAISHYRTVPIDRLRRLQVSALCEDDCLLFLWSTSPHLDQAISLLTSWGFAWATVGFVWDKQRVNPGFYTLSQIELCLIGKRGKIPTPRGSRNERQLVSQMRGEHSEKPIEVRRRIEAMFPTQRKLEIFARQRAVGWDVWGDEVESDVTLAWGA